LTEWRCKICGKLIKPGDVLCGNKECFIDWAFRSRLKGKVVVLRREYMWFWCEEMKRIENT